MPWYIVENKAIKVAVTARDPARALQHFEKRYPAQAQHGAYLVRACGPWLPGVEPRRG